MNGHGNGSTDSTPRQRRYLKKGELASVSRMENGYCYQKENGVDTNSTPASLHRRSSFGSVVAQDVHSITTGSLELDLCLCHHFQHCDLLLQVCTV